MVIVGIQKVSEAFESHQLGLTLLIGGHLGVRDEFDIFKTGTLDPANQAIPGGHKKHVAGLCIAISRKQCQLNPHPEWSDDSMMAHPSTCNRLSQISQDPDRVAVVVQHPHAHRDIKGLFKHMQMSTPQSFVLQFLSCKKSSASVQTRIRNGTDGSSPNSSQRFTAGSSKHVIAVATARHRAHADP